MKKLLAVGVIVLFLGLAIAPSINANISKASIDSELVEITTEVCGINGVKPNTVLLSKEDAEEVEKLIDDIERRLDNVETREEAEKIFKEAVVELDKYGLLGGLSIKQAQRLVTGGHQNPVIKKILEKIFRRYQGSDEEENFFCLVAGITSHTHFVTLVKTLLDNSGLGLFAIEVILLRYLILNINPIQIGRTVCLGQWGHFYPTGPAEGWLYTIGLNGMKWDREMWGALPLARIDLYTFYTCPAILGFFGLQLLVDGYDHVHFYLGSALWVKIESDN